MMGMTLPRFIAFCSVLLTACGASEGPDAISNRQVTPGSAQCGVTCHAPGSTISRDPVETNGSGMAGKHIRHVSEIGIPCDRCHDGYLNNANHVNGIRDTRTVAAIVSFDPVLGGTWNVAAGTCSTLDCHGPATVDWYGAASWTIPGCDVCHAADAGSRRTVMGAGGDFALNAAKVSRHVTGASDPSSDQCKVCHNMGMHMGGTVRLRNADTDSVITFAAAAPSTLEPFCLSCHDADGALSTNITGSAPLNPFNDGGILGTAPYPYATRIASSWTKSYGHGPNGNHATGSTLTCMGAGTPGTGCHGSGGAINAHGSVNDVIAARPFKYANGPGYVEADYDLCFTCHAAYAPVTKEVVFGVLQGGILDDPYGPSGGSIGPHPDTVNHPGETVTWYPPYYTAGVATVFRDHNDAGGSTCYDAAGGLGDCNDPGFWGYANMNLHWFHIALPTSDFRGTGASSRMNCVNCHDVHGSSTPLGAVYDEMGYTHRVSGVNAVGIMRLEAFTNSNLLRGYPFYCAFNCHPIQGDTKAWYDPLTE